MPATVKRVSTKGKKATPKSTATRTKAPVPAAAPIDAKPEMRHDEEPGVVVRQVPLKDGTTFELRLRFGSWTRNRTPEEQASDRKAMIADLERLRAEEREGELPYLDLAGIRAEVRRRRGDRT